MEDGNSTIVHPKIYGLTFVTDREIVQPISTAIYLSGKQKKAP